MYKGRRNNKQITAQIDEKFGKKGSNWMKPVDYLRELDLSPASHACIDIHERMGLIETRRTGMRRLVRVLPKVERAKVEE